MICDWGRRLAKFTQMGKAKEVAMQTLDLRPDPAPMRAIMAGYNGLAPGERLEALVAAYPPGLRMGLIEAGAKHVAERAPNGHWQLAITGASRSLSGTPGIHHVISSQDGRVWTCERGPRAARIDADSRAVACVREVAKAASHMAHDAARGIVFIGDAGGNALVAVRDDDLSVLGRFDIPGGPQLPLVTDDGIACITGSGADALCLVWPGPGGKFRSKTIEVGKTPHDPLVSPDGKSVLVACAGEGNVVRVSLADGTVTGRFAVGDGPGHLAAHPDGSRVYVANSFDGTLTCISPEGDLLGRVHSGGWAHVPEVTHDGKLVYVANFYDDALAVFDAITLERVATLSTDAYPHGLNISHDGRRVVATGYSGDHVRVFDSATAAETSHIEVGQGGAHTAFAVDGRTAFVGCSISNHLAVIDVERGAHLTDIRLDG